MTEPAPRTSRGGRGLLPCLARSSGETLCVSLWGHTLPQGQGLGVSRRLLTPHLGPGTFLAPAPHLRPRKSACWAITAGPYLKELHQASEEGPLLQPSPDFPRRLPLAVQGTSLLPSPGTYQTSGDVWVNVEPGGKTVCCIH